MRLYHGSNVIVDDPRVDKSRPCLDFGQGFYLTSIRAQAEKWARRRADWAGGVPYINEYEFSDNREGLRIREFASGEEAAWVEFVCDCRRGGEAFRQYDLVIGEVADDRVFAAVQMYFDGLWDMPTTLSALKFYEKNDQYCFVSQAVVDSRLTFCGASEVAR